MKKKNSLILLLLPIMAVLVLLLGGGIFVDTLRSSLWMESVSNVLEVTAQGAHTFEVYIDKSLETLDDQARIFDQFSSDDTASILRRLDLFDDPDSSVILVDLTHGVMYLDSGHYWELSPQSRQAYDALGDCGIRENYIDEYSGRQMIGYYQKFTFADGAQGLIQKGYLSSDVVREFSLSFYDNTGFSYIVNGNGDILLRPQHKNANRTFRNVFDVIELDGDAQENLDEFRGSMAAGNHGVAQFSLSGEEYIFAFAPLEGTDGWFLLTVIPNSVIMNETNRILNTSQIVFVLIACAILVVCLFIVLSTLYRQRVRKTMVELRYREQLFSMLSENTTDVYLMLSLPNFSVEYVTPNVEQVLGISRDSVMQDIRAIGKASYQKDETVDFDTLKELTTDSPAAYETERVHGLTGERRWFLETIYRVIIDEDERLVVIISDRTREKNSERLLQDALDIANAANSAKSTFLSNMSHDIRTPMNAIVGLATLLDRDAENPELVRKHIRQIKASSKHLLGLINDVLDMSKIESGKTALNLGEINLAEIVEEMDTIMRAQTKAKNQTFLIHTDEVQSEYLLGDQLRINQILINILSNASKYTPDGGRIEMTMRELPQITPNLAHIQFIITDNGIGMSQDYQKIIFQPFSREINSTTNQIIGIWLGMAITKNLVELMGGTIRLQSRAGEGTTFTVDLELRTQDQEEDRDFWNRYGIHRALVVDDEDVICRSVVSILESSGVSTEYALSGPQALEMVKASHRNHQEYDLILLDWMMPGLNGLATARSIRESVPAGAPIMVLTSYDWTEIEDDCHNAGISGFLSKPFFLSNFKHTIRTLKDGIEQMDTPLPQDKKLEGRHFLAAEDNELNAEILTELLDMVGVTCEIARNGQEAVQMFEASKPGHFDLVLMDVQMPIMNGYEATKAIRAGSHPQAQTIPIVAMTANAFADDVNNAMNAGMDAHLAKPVELDKLEQMLGDLLNKPPRYGRKRGN